MGNKFLSQQELIKQFEKIHGNQYDYSRVVYTGNNTKIDIVCKIHGVFSQWPSDHKRGHGCNKCNGGHKLTQEEFIQKVKNTHSNSYDLSKVVYKNSSSKIQVICKEHGPWMANPTDLVKGAGCPQCGKIKQRNTRLKNGNMVDPDTVDKFVKYTMEVRKLSDYNFIKYYHDINPLNLKRGKNFHLDHIISITYGFIHNMPVAQIASPKNLRVISATENRKKNIYIDESAISFFDDSNIKTKDLNEELRLAMSKKRSSPYKIIDIKTGIELQIDSLPEWCKDNNFVESSVRWSVNYGSAPFKGRYLICKLK